MKVRFGILYCIIAMLFSAVCFGEETKFIVRVGYWENYGISVNSDGELYGYTYDYMNDIAAINNWDIEYVKCDWDEGLQMLADGRLDIFGALQKTEEREKFYDYSAESFGFEYGAVYVNENNHSVLYNDPHSIDGKTLGSAKGNYFLKSFDEYCQENNIAVKIQFFDDSDLLQTALDEGTIDLLLTGSLRSSPHSKVAVRLSSEPIYYATTKGNTKVLNGMNYALRQIKKDNPYYDAELNNKYFQEAAISSPTFTYSERQYINKNPKLSVVFHPDWKPYDYYDEVSQKYVGISVDILDYISDFTGITFEQVYTKNYIEALEMAADGEVDLVVGMIDSKPMRQQYDLSASVAYVKPSFVFIGKRGSSINQLNGQYVGVQKNNIGTLKRLEQDFPKAIIKTYDTTEDCLRAVLIGEVPFAVLTTNAADEVLRGSQYNKLVIVSVLSGDVPVCFATSNDSDQTLISVLNKAIRSIKSSQMDEIIFKHTVGLPYQPTISETIQQNLLLFVVITLIIISAFVAFATWANSNKTRELNKMAYYDQLTGHINLVKFKIEMEKILSAKPRAAWAVLSLDINKFKSINDLLGYDHGDKLIKHLAKCISDNLMEGEIFARENADKFIMLIKFFDEESFDSRFQEISANLDLMERQSNSKMKLILSGGLYPVKNEDDNITAIVDRANIARKLVKDSHRSTYAVYNQKMYEKLNREKQIENTMAASLAQGEFVVYLQPKFSIRTRGIVGAEALVRWQNPERGLIPPDEFIPLFEKNGFVVNIDFFVFREVCKKLRQWLNMGLNVVPISVNLSRCHISNMSLAQELCNIAKEYEMTPGLIELELTESAFTGDDNQTLIQIMENLHDAGFILSMDDFGSGLSSLTQLKQLPIDYLKLDKSFLSSQPEENKEKAMFRNVVNLSKDMGIATVAEGVETEAQYAMLRDTGCDIAQGYLFARPMTILDFEKRFIIK